MVDHLVCQVEDHYFEVASLVQVLFVVDGTQKKESKGRGHQWKQGEWRVVWHCDEGEAD